MVTLIARWSIKPGCEAQARTALRQLARRVRKEEPGTLVYLVHFPDLKGFSLPLPSPQTVTFFEGYRNHAALMAHLNGPVYREFLARHQDLFLTTTVTGGDGQPVTSPFVRVDALRREGGFIRPEAAQP